MVNTFEELAEEAPDDEQLAAGDECPEPHCERELRELRHPRDATIDADNHPDAPEVEVVCIHDGIVDSR